MRIESRTPLPYALGWHLAAALLLAGLASLRLGAPPWQLSTKQLELVGPLLIAYLAAAAIVWLRGPAETLPARLIDTVVTGLATFSVVFLAMLVGEPEFSRIVLLMVFVAGIGLLTVGTCLLIFPRVMLAGIVVATALLLALTSSTSVVLRPTLPKGESTREIPTAYYGLKAISHDNYVPPASTFYAGGGFSRIGSRYLLVTNDGSLYLVGENGRIGPGPLKIDSLPQVVPLNRQAFMDDAGSGGWSEWFRVMDVLVQDRGDRIRVFASHHHWNTDEKCVVVRISMIEATEKQLTEATAPMPWKTVFETTPCLPTSPTGWPFRGMEGGGRMALWDDDSLILTVGDHGFNGVDFTTDYVDALDASYGKTLQVDVDTGRSEVFSIGHRNPQGLWIGEDRSVWITEHGPQGGDELNHVRRGVHYGWPHVTYGTNYGTQTWPLNPRQGRHDGYPRPAFAWVPSVGTSNLIAVEKDLFPAWKGDFLVATLHGQSLFRIRMEGERVVLVEPIPIGQRVRDLTEDADGRIVLWTDAYSFITLEPGPENVFAECAPCHEFGGGNDHRTGPDLAGVFGRPIASASSFPYSTALQQRTGVWDEASLDAFLEDPQTFAPGTSMAGRGIQDPARRRKLIEYLRAHSR